MHNRPIRSRSHPRIELPIQDPKMMTYDEWLDEFRKTTRGSVSWWIKGFATVVVVLLLVAIVSALILAIHWMWTVFW